MAKKVALIGFSFRFPSTNSTRYWSDLLAGRDLVTEVDAGRWALDTYCHPNKNNSGTSYTFAAGSIGDISGFDAGFFGISPREAALMDPQQRLLLEMSWEALENSGIKPSSIRGSQCGVYIGIASADYSYRMADDLAALDSSAATGNTASIAANRISYVFDLRGPSMAIDTACSSAMVAFHQACKSILSGENTQAITGGVSLHLHPYGFIIFSKASMLSKRGRCQVFDAAGDGYVRSEGGGIFFLKDYDQAIADGNPILAIVANSAVNTDGRKSGLTVPNPKMQAALMEHAYKQAGIDPATIDYVEAHGTGTAIGDPIETRAIGDALGKHRAKNNPLPIGSIKSNLGHMEAASGVAGLVKALYCIKYRTVPATIGVSTPNPAIQFNDWNLKVVTQNYRLKETGKLTVGINSFGFGGANAHVILESHETRKAIPSKPQKLNALPVLISAKDTAALKQAAQEFAVFLNTQPQPALYDIAYNTIFNRELHDHRALLFGDDTTSIAKALADFATTTSDSSGLQHGKVLTAPAGPAFIYSGNGSQWVGMGKQLLAEVPLFRATIREIDALFSLYADYSLEAELAGKNGENRYQFTEIAQPALFALQVGITRMLAQHGIKPVAVAGHSVGEVAAAWAAGALTLKDAVAVIYHRSHAQGTTKGQGKMTAVGCSLQIAEELLQSLALATSLTVAGVNSSRGVTIAGDPVSLAKLESGLAYRSIPYKRLDLDYAFHSPAMDAIESDIRLTLASLKPNSTSIPFYSTVTGDLLDGRELGAEYWWHNIRQPVLFEQASKHLLATGTNILVEIGPHAVMQGYLNDCLKDTHTEGRVITTLTRNNDAPNRVWAAANQAIIAGAPVDWKRLFPVAGQYVQLPTYPWQRERHWHPVTSASMGLLERNKIHPLLGYALKQQELTWENQLDTLALPTLADHVVGDATVFPGTGFAEIALAAALAWHPGELAEIEELEIRSPLLLNDTNAKVIRTTIEAQDGSLTIKGRETGTESWALHAVGRILREPGELLLQLDVPEFPERRPDFNHASHEAMTRAAGLTYGAEFQRISHGWVEGSTALAVFTSPEIITPDLASTHLHPAILDCTFQLIIQLLKADLAMYEGIAFVPTKMGRIAFRSSSAAPHYAKATLLTRARHSLTADFTVFDTDGMAIAVIKQARFRSIRLHKSATDHLRFLDFYTTPAPHPLAPLAAPALEFTALRSAMDTAIKQCDLNRYATEVEPLLDSLCSQFTLQALQQLSDSAGKLCTKKFASYQKATPQVAPYFKHLLKMVEQDQIISAKHSGWEISPDQANAIQAADIWNSLVADYPDYFQIIQSVGRVGLHLSSLLTGEIDPAQLISNEFSSATLMQLVLGADAKQQIGAALRTLIDQSLNQLVDGQRLAIMEIAEDAPVFAVDICTRLDFNRSDYIFASASPNAIEQAAQLRERNLRIQTCQIDAELTTPAPTTQLAIVHLNFNTTEAALAAISYAHARLMPGGSLLLLGQHPSRWMDFICGSQSRQTAPSIETARHATQRPAQFWQQQMNKMGFAAVNHQDFVPDVLTGPYLLMAQMPALSKTNPAAIDISRSWLVLADLTGYSVQLARQMAEKMKARGDNVRIAQGGDAAHIASLLLATPGQLDGIIHLAGLNALTASDSPLVLLNQQVDRCAIAAAIIQACESAQIDTTCWLITSGVTANLRINTPRTTEVSLVDTTLWGFGRTLMNEATNYAVRMVDIETSGTLNSVANALDRELVRQDKETEIILTASGARLAPRLRLEADPQMTANPVLPAPTLRLGFQFPGQLRNLKWETFDRQSPGAQEIEVEVHATGLNFRDLMYALGLLSDEAIENGFAGSTLGLEFAGIVLSTGANTPGFAVGDRVVGFGPSSLSNRVITQANAISHMPSNITFEAAATIPSTFLTVYYALYHLAQLQPGEKILIHGAAGGVGIAAIQIAKLIGAEIYATAGSDEKRDFLQLLGIQHIYDSRSLAFADEILADTDGKGVDVVLNSLAGEAINRNFNVLKPFGRFLELGKRDFYENTKIGLRPFRNNISYFGIDADQLMQMRPELTRRLFAEVMNLFSEGALHPLPYTVFEADDIVDAFRYMQQARQIGKIVITYRNGISQVDIPAKTVKPKLALSADATYLVTGGLSGFGLRTAEWLATKGARHLVLISRSGPTSDEAVAAIAQLETNGVNIHAVSCDVTDEQALARLLTVIANTLPPLKGIVHAAMVIDDGLIRNMDAEQIRRVLAPKVLGAYYLHQMTSHLSLDYFILYSSATTLFGNPGQGNYVAANAALEALARQRRRAGLAATCVRWGAIDDVGFLARNAKIKDTLQSRMGGAALNSGIALDALESMLLANRSGLGVLELDWKALSRFLPCAGSAKFSEMTQQDSDDNSPEDNSKDIQRLLAELSGSELLSTITDMLKREVSEILRVAVDKIDANRSIYDMGLDSLMGVELMVAVESRFGIHLSVMALSESPTITKLAERLILQLQGTDNHEAHTSDDKARSQIQQVAAQHGTTVSADAIASLVEDIQTRGTSSSNRMIH